MLKRPLRGSLFAAGLLVGLAAAFAGQTAFARDGAGTTATIRACVGHDGELTIVTGERRWKRCPASRRLEWRVQGEAGPQGPAGPTGPQGVQGPAGAPGANALVSADGRFRIDISNRGIFLRGPGGTVYVDRFGAAALPGNQTVGR